MEPDIDVMRLWRDEPGHIDRLLNLAIWVACAITLAITLVGSKLLWSYYGRGEARPWWIHTATLLAAGIVLAAAARRSLLSRSLRLAVVLPAAHALALVASWVVWHARTADLSHDYVTTQMIRWLPAPVAALAATALFAGLARWIARGRRGEAIHGFVMLALATLLLFGLWLPIASVVWRAASPPSAAAVVLVPPLAAAAAFTALVFRRPAAARRLRGWLYFALLVLFVTAIASLGRNDERYVLFGNFVHVLLALGAVAIGALGALAGTTWWRAHRAGAAFAGTHALTGTIETDDGDDGFVGCFEVTSWLRGPRALLRSFTLRTAAGRLVIHGGAQLVAPLPLATTPLRIGESLVVLHPGDPVVIAGLEPSGVADPYRGANAPIGAGGVLVASARQHYGVAHVALMMWRPCLAYLAITIIIGVPCLLAASVFT